MEGFWVPPKSGLAFIVQDAVTGLKLVGGRLLPGPEGPAAFLMYEGPNGEVLFISLSTWDSANDAREFFDAYAKRTRLRYPDAAEQADSDSDGASSIVSTQKSWKTIDGTVTVGLRGSRVVIIEGPSAHVNATLLRRLS